MKSIHELAELFSEMPGIGPRQARRVVQFILGKDQKFRDRLSELIQTISTKTMRCPVCFRYDGATERGMCTICADGSRDKSSLMIVEKDIDVESVEASGAYKGLYFVLGGLMSMTRQRKNGNGPRVKDLMARLEKNNIREVIFALSTTPEGDYTARELAKEVQEKHPNIKTTLLGRGLSVGAEIEYADSETLRSALKNRA